MIAGEQAATAELLELAAILLATRLLDNDEELDEARLDKLDKTLDFELLELKDELDLRLDATDELAKALLTELDARLCFELLAMAELTGAELTTRIAELALLKLDEAAWLATTEDTTEDCTAELDATELDTAKLDTVESALLAEVDANDDLDELATLVVATELVADGDSLPAVPPPPQAVSQLVDVNSKPNLKHESHVRICSFSRLPGSGLATNFYF